MNALRGAGRSRAGLSLIDLLASLAVFVASTVFLLQAFNRGYLAAGDMENVNRALYIANGTLENIRSQSYLSVVSQASTPIAAFPGFSSQVDVTFPQTSPANQDIKKVVVTVRYPVTTGSGGTGSVQTRTLLVNN